MEDHTFQQHLEAGDGIPDDATDVTPNTATAAATLMAVAAAGTDDDDAEDDDDGIDVSQIEL